YLKAQSLQREPEAPRVAIWFDVVKQFPDELPVVEASYLRLAEVALGASDLPAARAQALAANTWLAAHASTGRRITASYRLGKLHDAERDRAAARAAYCSVLADTGRFANDAAARIARGFLDSELEPLAAACAASACPCTMSVLGDLIEGLLQIEDDARAGKVIELALSRTPDREHAARWSCAQVQIHERAQSPRAASLRAALPANTPCEVATPSAPAGAPAEAIARYAKQSRALERCFEDAMERGRWQAAALELELVTDGAGRVERTAVRRSTFDPETASCLERTAKRHHFVGVARSVIVIPFRFAPP
ncbi:MAG TPA: hypothetical protein VIU61_30895, partial [Kofleriaceae bacterium]